MRILVVDASRAMRRIIIHSLSSIGEEDVVEATDGLDAFSKAKEQKVDLVLTDWVMPGLDGLGLTRRLRAESCYLEIPIIMIATEAEKSSVLDAIKAGVNNYILKPFTPETLKRKIEATVGKISK